MLGLKRDGNPVQDRCEQIVGRHLYGRAQRQNGSTPSWRIGDGDLLVAGRARMHWGEHLEFTAEAGPGDFIYVPPFVPHQEINPSPGEMLSCVVARSGQEPIVVNLDIAPAEPPEEVYWVDPNHPRPF